MDATLQRLHNNSYHLAIRSSLLAIQSTLSLQETMLQSQHTTFTDIKSTIASQNTTLQKTTKTLVEFFSKISSFQPPPTASPTTTATATISVAAPPLSAAVAASTISSFPSDRIRPDSTPPAITPIQSKTTKSTFSPPQQAQLQSQQQYLFIPANRQAIPQQQVSSESDPESKPKTRNLILQPFVFNKGVFHLKIDENYLNAISKLRFQDPDVFLPDLNDRKLCLSRFDKNTTDFSVVVLTSKLEAVPVIKHDPFEIVVIDSSSKSKELILSLNYGLFDFETLNPKKEGEDWEERFRSHTNSRPNGLHDICFELSFHGAEFVYGIPKHGSEKWELQYTRGLDSEPYRLFNLDVFEYLHDSPFGLYGSIPYMISHGEKNSSDFFGLCDEEIQISVQEKNVFIFDPGGKIKFECFLWRGYMGMLNSIIIRALTFRHRYHQFMTLRTRSFSRGR